MATGDSVMLQNKMCGVSMHAGTGCGEGWKRRASVLGDDCATGTTMARGGVLPGRLNADKPHYVKLSEVQGWSHRSAWAACTNMRAVTFAFVSVAQRGVEHRCE